MRSRRNTLKCLPLASTALIVPRSSGRQSQQTPGTANGGTDPYPIPWLDQNAGHSQPAGPNLEPSHRIQHAHRAPSVATRRSFIRRATSGIAAFGLLGGVRRAAEAQLVWKASEWKLAEFQKLVNEPARIKQVFDIVQIGEGTALNSVKNALNGLRFGFGIPGDQIKIVAGLHGAANMLNYDDYVWDKYNIGEWLNVTDPGTGKPVVKNLFYKSKGGLKKESAARDPDDLDSIYQDTSMQALQARGVQFLSCHTALEEQVRVLIRRYKLPESPEQMMRDMLAHTEPGVLVVAAMGAAIAVLQAEGHYTYITA
jgi:intracellular sulfur oxidation DsrE/DsrF family protein